MPKIATIIHYCSNDYRFLKKAVQECSHFSTQILVPFSDRFFDGGEENRFLLEQSMRENPECTFVRFEFNVKQLYSPFIDRVPMDEDWLCCWHSTSRYVGRFFVRPEVEWILFIDADEIVEGARFAKWVETMDPELKAVWFGSYMYGQQAHQRKEEKQLTGLLLRKDCVTPHQILNPQERCGIFQDVVGRKKMAMDDSPLFHHYSWVRSEAECRQKAMTWAKKDQRDWISWLNEVEPTESVTPYFDPLSVTVPRGEAQHCTQPNELLATRRQIMEMENALL